MATFESIEGALKYYEGVGVNSPNVRRCLPAVPGPDRNGEIEAVLRQHPRMPDSWLEFARQVVLLDRSCGAADLSPVSGSESIATALSEAHLHGTTPYSSQDEHDRVLWVASYECSFVYVAARDCVRFHPGEVLIRDLDASDPPLERLNSSMSQFFLMTANIDALTLDHSADGLGYDEGVVRGFVDRFSDDAEQAKTWHKFLGLVG